jgi:hypothetical protein
MGFRAIPAKQIFDVALIFRVVEDVADRRRPPLAAALCRDLIGVQGRSYCAQGRAFVPHGEDAAHGFGVLAVFDQASLIIPGIAERGRATGETSLGGFLAATKEGAFGN